MVFVEKALDSLIIKTPLKKRTRIWEIDFLRGVCILLMVFDHFMFDMMYFPFWTTNYYYVDESTFSRFSDFAYNYWQADYRIYIRIFVIFIFLFLSGISCSLSRSNVKRFIKLTLASSVITIATHLGDSVADLGIFIAFGILHIIAFSVLIYICMNLVCKNEYFFLACGAVITLIGILKLDFMNIPETKILNFSAFSNVVTGSEYHGADSYGIFPYTGFFLIGAYAGKIFYKEKTSLLPRLGGLWQRPVSFVGRNTIWVYILHQPIVLAIVILIGMSFGYKFT